MAATLVTEFVRRAHALTRRVGAQARMAALSSSVAVAAIAAPGTVDLGGGARADSPAGVYLAARHAEASGDLTASAHYQRRAVSFNPGNDDMRRVAVLYSVLAGEMRSAMRMARPLLQKEGDVRLAARVAIADAMRRDEYDRVADLVEKSGENLTTIERVLALGWAQYGLGELDAARETFAAKEEPAIVQIVAGYHSGLLEAMEGNDEQALAAFEIAREASSGWSRRLGLAAAAAAARSGKPDMAREIYDELAAGAANDSSVRDAVARYDAGLEAKLTVANPAEGLAEIFFAHAISAATGSSNRPVGESEESRRASWIDDAREALFAARLAHHIAPTRSDVTILVGDLLTALWQYEPAAEVFGSVPPGDATYESARVGMASALAGAERMDEALDVLREATQGENVRPATFFQYGELLNREKRFDECAAAYEEGISLLPKVEDRDWIRVFELAICHAQRGDWESAEAGFNRSLELNPGQPDVLNYLGYSLVEKGIRIEEARQMIEEAVAARPKAGFIVDSLGWVLYRIGDYEGAVRELEKAVELSPAEAVINDHYGDALWMVGRKMEARFQWKRALSFEPDQELDRIRVERKLEIGLDDVRAEEEAAGRGDSVGVRTSAPPENAKNGG